MEHTASRPNITQQTIQSRPPDRAPRGARFQQRPYFIRKCCRYAGPVGYLFFGYLRVLGSKTQERSKQNNKPRQVSDVKIRAEGTGRSCNSKLQNNAGFECASRHPKHDAPCPNIPLEHRRLWPETNPPNLWVLDPNTTKSLQTTEMDSDWRCGSGLFGRCSGVWLVGVVSGFQQKFPDLVSKNKKNQKADSETSGFFRRLFILTTLNCPSFYCI